MGICLGALALLGSGCTADMDPRQAETCRIAAAGVFDARPLRVLSQSSLDAPQAQPPGVAIDLEAGPDKTRHRIECLFASSAGAREPVVVRTDEGVLSEPRLFMLNRFWLGTADAAGSDPLIAERGRGLPTIPFTVAYPLQALLAALPNAAIYSLLAATYSLVYALFGRINLAFGEITAVGGVAALIGATMAASRSAGLILLVACGVGVWAAGLHGALIERLTLWPLRRSTEQQGLVATIGLALFLQEYLRLSTGNQPRYIPSVLSRSIGLVRADAFIVTVTPLSLVVFGIAIAASLSVLCLLGFTGFGRNWRATSDDPVAASLFGVDPRRLSLQTFVLASGLAGLAGACVTLISGSVGFAYTTTLGLKALIAAVVGGIGSVPGAFLGGLGIAVLEAGWSAYFPIVDRDLVIDCLLVAMLIFRPGGLFGYRELRPRSI